MIFTSDVRYCLNGIVCHDGNSTASGHYTSWVRHNESWYKFDDFNVRESVNFLEVENSVRKNSYVLMYALDE